jgi:hypothetical protein
MQLNTNCLVTYISSVNKNMSNSDRGPIPCRSKIFLSSWASDWLWFQQSHIQWNTGCYFPVLKRPEHEDDYVPLSSTEIRNCGAMPPYTLHNVVFRPVAGKRQWNNRQYNRSYQVIAPPTDMKATRAQYQERCCFAARASMCGKLPVILLLWLWQWQLVENCCG